MPILSTSSTDTSTPQTPNPDVTTPPADNLAEEAIVSPANNTTPFTSPTPSTGTTSQNTPSGASLNGQVTIINKEAPIVILFGPTSCGKTMTLIRLTKYLSTIGFTVKPDTNFRPSNDTLYKEDCDKFNNTVDNPIAAPGTSGYMLVHVIAPSGKVICQILEAPGEYYFNPVDPNKTYPHYFNIIAAAPNRRVWCPFIEPDWDDPQTRANYVRRIQALIPAMQANDRTVFIYNKIDKTNFVRRPGVVNEHLAIEHVNQLYPMIFDRFRCEIPIVKLFRKYDCSFVPFQTGLFTSGVDSNGKTVVQYAPASDLYPQRLWKEIRRSI